MTLKDALGRTPMDLEDFVLASAMFDFVKHQTTDDPRDAAFDRINSWTNFELVEAISAALLQMRAYRE